jgi:hypothetical protein
MASRTSASTGVTITIIALAVFTLAFFIAFAIYFGKHSEAQRKVIDLEQKSADIIGGERQQDNVRVLIEESKKDRKSLVAYLVSNREAMLQRIAGNPRETLAGIEAKLQGVEGSDQPLVSIINGMSTQVQGLKGQLAESTTAKDRALVDLKNEVDRVRGIEDQHKKTLDQVNAQVDQYRAEIETYRQGADNFRTSQSAQVERIRTEAAESESRLQEQIKQLTEQKLILEAQVANLRGQRASTLFKGGDEAALVDGAIIGINDADRSVVINLGRDKRVVLGMSFTVYANAASIKPDDVGNYPPGKATLEVINVNESTSTCRLTSELRGNPVARGDVVANAVYDPAKTYKFVVFGAFDTDRDGIATPAEIEQISSLVKSWGGEVVADLGGDTDFLVLGSRPILPPRPGADAPLEVALEFARRLTDVEKYDNLIKQAQSSGIPILNENRLYTLVGRAPAAKSIRK